ncbi:AAA family ATPase [Pediococcus acidilactici]
MKIKRIEIYGFGKWQNVTFDLQNDLQVFYGMNEAGKSTLRQFIYSVFFGFAQGRGSNKYLKYVPKKGRGSAGYGGAIEIEYQKHPYRIERVKGKNGGTVTIKDLIDQNSVSPDFLGEILGPIDQHTYERLLGFNQSDLDDFNDLGNRDDLRRHILRMGAVGSEEWIQFEKDLKKDADKMHTASSRTRELDKKVKHYEQAKQHLQDDRDQLPDYQSAKALEDQNRTELQGVRQRINQVSKQTSHQQTLVDAWNNYHQILTLRQRVQNVSKADLQLDLGQVSRLVDQIRKLTENVQRTQQKLRELPANPQKPGNLEQLTDLQAKLPVAQVNHDELIKAQQRQTALTNQLTELQENNSVDLNQLKPMDSATLKQVKQLLQKQAQTAAEVNQLRSAPVRTSTTTGRAANVNLIWGVGIVLAAVDFFLPINVIVKLILLVVIALGGYGFAKQTGRSEQPDSELTDALQTAEENNRQINDKLHQVGVQTGFDVVPATEWVLLQSEVVSYQQIKQELADLKHRQQTLQEKLADFWRTVTTVLQIDAASSQPTLEELTERVTKQIQQIQHQQSEVQTRKILTQNLGEQQTELKQAQDKFGQLATPPLDDHFDEWLAQLTETQKQAVRLRDLEKTVAPELQEELQKYTDFTELKEQQAVLTEQLQQLKAQEQTLMDERTQRIGELTGFKNQIDILNEQQALAEEETELKDLIDEWLTLQLGAKWVDETLGVATKGRLPLIIQQANEYFAKITDGHYQQVEFDSDDAIHVIDQTGQAYELGELSKGTLEQLYISIRFAFMQAFADTVDLPIIIDDAFVAFDDRRLAETFGLLKQIAKQTQIIYFSAKRGVYQLVDQHNVVNLNEK